MAIKKKVKRITKPLKRNKVKSVNAGLKSASTATDTSGLTKEQRRKVAGIRVSETKKRVAEYKGKLTVGNKKKVTSAARNRSGGAGSKAGNTADLLRSANNAGAELKAKNAAAKKRVAAAKKKAAESKPPTKRRKTTAKKKKK